MHRPLPAPHRVHLSEEWLLEWVEYGLRELSAYLMKQARFDAYLARTNRKEPHP